MASGSNTTKHVAAANRRSTDEIDCRLSRFPPGSRPTRLTQNVSPVAELRVYAAAKVMRSRIAVPLLSVMKNSPVSTVEVAVADATEPRPPVSVSLAPSDSHVEESTNECFKSPHVPMLRHPSPTSPRRNPYRPDRVCIAVDRPPERTLAAARGMQSAIGHSNV